MSDTLLNTFETMGETDRLALKQEIKENEQITTNPNEDTDEEDGKQGKYYSNGSRRKRVNYAKSAIGEKEETEETEEEKLKRKKKEEEEKEAAKKKEEESKTKPHTFNNDFYTSLNPFNKMLYLISLLDKEQDKKEFCTSLQYFLSKGETKKLNANYGNMFYNKLESKLGNKLPVGALSDLHSNFNIFVMENQRHYYDITKEGSLKKAIQLFPIFQTVYEEAQTNPEFKDLMKETAKNVIKNGVAMFGLVADKKVIAKNQKDALEHKDNDDSFLKVICSLFLSCICPLCLVFVICKDDLKAAGVTGPLLNMAEASEKFTGGLTKTIQEGLKNANQQQYESVLKTKDQGIKECQEALNTDFNQLSINANLGGELFKVFQDSNGQDCNTVNDTFRALIGALNNIKYDEKSVVVIKDQELEEARRPKSASSKSFVEKNNEREALANRSVSF